MMTEEQSRQWKRTGDKIAEAVQTDPGGRGLLSGRITTPTAALLQSLEDVPRAVLLTGFPVRLPDGTVVGETDGPSGLANIAWALEQTGTAVRALTDRTCCRQLEAAMQARGCLTVPEMIPQDRRELFLEELFAAFAPSHLITLERPGKAKDGHFYNMRGGMIDPMITDTDCIMETARRRGVSVISVGDGGNELGMGALRQLIRERVPLGDLICADAPADIALVSGVSNWWGWGIAAFLSLIHEKDLLPSPETERAMLHAVTVSGGADGCTARIEDTVDGLPPEVHLAVLDKVRKAAGRDPAQ